MKLLHIMATPRSHSSNTLRVANAFLEGMYAKYPDMEVEVLDLFDVDLPSVAGTNIEAKYTLMAGKLIDKRHQESWKQIESFIEHFKAADHYLITCPMWNFSIPYTLKYYIDCIVQPGYTFRYMEDGRPEGMVHNKRMVIITSRGGDYSESSPFHAYDFQEPYLRAIFGWMGITDIEFVNAQPMDITPEIRQVAVQKGIEDARALAAVCDWVVTRPSEAKDLTGLKPKPIKK
ncbi:MAG: NAD(P)H-dependent oxidoreductase [Chloroflexota bacterium]|jgi:FMN-dependent NADH-azoreductase